MNFRNALQSLVQLPGLVAQNRRLQTTVDHLRRAVGRMEERQLATAESVEDAEFQVYSQWGEDGVLQWLLRQVPIAREIFVEFGVEDYTEANTRWLLVQHLWSGLVIDGSARNVEAIRRDPIYWQCNLKAAQAFITRENINTLLIENGVSGEIGLLSVDIDGVDYWVWEAITAVKPAIVVAEYNHRFGPERAVTVPYASDFQRGKAHPSNVYYGASISALTALARRKGYALVAGNRAGNNCFFVERSLLAASLGEKKPDEVWRAAQFREARNGRGELALLSPEAEADLLRGLPLMEVE